AIQEIRVADRRGHRPSSTATGSLRVQAAPTRIVEFFRAPPNVSSVAYELCSPTELFVRDVHSRIDEPQQCGSKPLLLHIPFDVRVHASGQVTQLSIDMIASG